MSGIFFDPLLARNSCSKFQIQNIEQIFVFMGGNRMLFEQTNIQRFVKDDMARFHFFIWEESKSNKLLGSNHGIHWGVNNEVQIMTIKAFNFLEIRMSTILYRYI